MVINQKKGNVAIIILVVILLVVGVGAIVMSKNKAAKNEAEKQAATEAAAKAEQGKMMAMPRSAEISLNEQGKSGQSGKATITEVGDKTKVTISLAGKASTVPQPAHIHLKSCADIGGVKYPLSNVDKGSSVTTLDVSIDEILAGLPLSINVHKSASQIATYVACGDLSTSTMKMTGDMMMNAGENMGAPMGEMDMGKKAVAQINYTDQGFTPPSIEIKVGETVRFTNMSATGMWVASNPHPTHTDYPALDAKKVIFRGEFYEFNFSKSGTFKFHNHTNSSQGGTIVVK